MGYGSTGWGQRHPSAATRRAASIPQDCFARPTPSYSAGRGGEKLEGLTEFSGRLILDHRPVRVGLGDMARDIFFPLLLNVGIEVEIQFSFLDFPELWVSVELGAHCLNIYARRYAKGAPFFSSDREPVSRKARFSPSSSAMRACNA